mgnify:CR=1 FL=1
MSSFLQGRRSRSNFQSLIKALPGEVYLIDRNGVITDSNQNYPYGFQNLNGKSFLQLIPPEYTPQARETLQYTLETASIDSFRYINPVGHALVETALPRTRELKTDTQGMVEAVNTVFAKTALDAAIAGATGYCLTAQSVGPSGYYHRLRLKW